MNFCHGAKQSKLVYTPMIGLDISDQTIKLVRLSAKRKLISHCMKTLSPGVMEHGIVVDQKKMAEEIAAIFASCHISLKVKDSIVASIPETQSFLRVIEIPAMEEDEIHEAVRWEIAQHIPFGLDNVYIDWQPSASSEKAVQEGHIEVEVGAAQKKVVDPLHEAMKSAGLDIAAFELESQAIVRSLISSELKRKQGILIIDLGSTATNVVVHDFGAIRFTASLPQGVVELLKDVTPADGKAIMENLNGLPKELSDRVEEKISLSADTLVRDIQGIVQFYNTSGAKNEVKEIILTGGGSNLPGLDVVFLKYFTEVRIQRGNPWVNVLTGKNVTKPPMNIQESVRFCTAIGLALRNVVSL